MKNENAATVLKALKIRKVAKHSLRKGAEPKASLKPLRISFISPGRITSLTPTRCTRTPKVSARGTTCAPALVLGTIDPNRGCYR